MIPLMTYAIFRVAKLKTIGNIVGSANHAFRENDTPNADPKRLKENKLAGAATTAELLASVKSKLPEKRRKDAVLALEYFIGASPEAFGDNWQKSGKYKKDYFNDALAWLAKRHGAENVVAAQIHLDEKTPHMSVYVVPRTAEGKLSAKQFVGGRTVLSKMQSDFAREVGARHRLKRGIEGSRATHTTRKQFYGALDATSTLKAPEPPKKSLIPNLKELNQYRDDLVDFAQVAAQVAAVAQLDKRDKDQLASEAAELRGKVLSLENQVKDQSTEIRRLNNSGVEYRSIIEAQTQTLNNSGIEYTEIIEKKNQEAIDLKRQVLMTQHQLKEKTAEVEALKRPTKVASKTSTNDHRP